MDTSAISGTNPASTYVATTSTGTDASGDFASVLASQTASSDATTDTTSTSAADQALNAYSAGQVTAYALTTDGTDGTAGTSTDTAVKESSATTDTTSTTAGTTSTSSSGDTSSTSGTEESSETSASSDSAGFPAEVNAEWTPSHMQFFDESTGKWMDDNIPHRVTDNGDLQYYADGEWHQDTAIKHRMVDENGNPIALVDENGNPISGDATTASTGTDGTTDTSNQTSQDAIPTADIYFNQVLQTWKLCNLPEAVDQNGNRLYYWGDSWHSDGWQHHDATGSGVQVAGDPAGAAGLSSGTSVASTSTDTSSGGSTDTSNSSGTSGSTDTGSGTAQAA